jgi:hypothetical protein
MENGMSILINHTSMLDDLDSNWCIVVTKFTNSVNVVPNCMSLLIEMSNDYVDVYDKCYVKFD